MEEKSINILYLEGGEELLEHVKPLWEKLNHHHMKNSIHFAAKYQNFKFEERMKPLLEKVNKGDLKVDLVKDEKTGTHIGYCMSSITEDGIGEVESLYLDMQYRGFDIGDKLMTRALKWMDDKQVKSKRIGVASGNEKIFSFYSRYGFYPSNTTLVQK